MRSAAGTAAAFFVVSLAVAAVIGDGIDAAALIGSLVAAVLFATVHALVHRGRSRGS